MSLVLQNLREHNADFKAHKKDNAPLFSARTDFPIYDYLNGTIGKVVRADGGLDTYLNMGMAPGVHSFIGKTQSGKTSLAVKLCGNLVSKYPNSVFYFRDAEKTTEDSRIFNLTGWDINTFNDKLDYNRYDIDHDYVYNEIRNICQAKESLRDKIMIDTGMKDSLGNRIKIFPPDVYLVDSLPFLNPCDDDADIKKGKNEFEVKEAQVSHNTEGMRIAGSNKLLVVKVADLLYKYNIRLVLINHIGVNTGQLGENPKYIQKQMMYLRQNEKLPGGATYLYSCTNITRTDFMGKMDDDEFGPDISGTHNKITMVKNKANRSGIPVELIFDQVSGYNSLLSSFQYLLNRGYGFEGNPRSMYLKCMPEVTFTKRTLWGKLVDDFRKNPQNPMFVKALHATASHCLYYDFVIGKPDPVVDNWYGGNQNRLLFGQGVTSK